MIEIKFKNKMKIIRMVYFTALFISGCLARGDAANKVARNVAD
jgi:PBP1b-binding outer membrane lipoprotein LpoB